MTTSSTTTGQGRRQFHLRRRLGAGAFGEVFLADMISAGGFRRRVAIKLLHADIAKRAGAAKRMRDEARILGHLAHRHIVSVLDLIQLGDRWAVVMDYVPGADLEQVIAWCADHDIAFPIGAVLEMGSATATALDAGWSSDNGEGRPLQVVHRDIKPSNLRITADGDLKVLDFGVARVDMEHREAATREAGWIGTERYMSPERIMLDGDTPAGDVYALGASLIELILGEPLGRTPVMPDRHKAMVDAQLARIEPMLAGNPAAADVIATLRSIVTAEPTERPDARSLAVTLDRLARQVGGTTLREFAAQVVPPLIEPAADQVVDRILTEGMDSAPPPTTARTLDGSGSGTLYDQLEGSDSGAVAPHATAGSSIMRRPAALGVAILVLVVAIGATTIGIAAGTSAIYWRSGPSPVAAPTTSASTGEAPSAVVAPLPSATASAADRPAGDGNVGQPDTFTSASSGTASPDAGPDPSEPPITEVPIPEVPIPEVPIPEVPAPVGRAAAAKPVAASTAAPVSAPVVPATTAPLTTALPGPRVRAAKVTLPESAALTVTCGDVRRTGTSSVALRDVPSGTCAVEAMYLGAALSTTFQLDGPAEVNCAAVGGNLTCSAR